MGDGGRDPVLLERLHGALLVLRELRVGDIGAGRDRALDDVECLLPLDPADEAQPVLGPLGVRGALGQELVAGAEEVPPVATARTQADDARNAQRDQKLPATHNPASRRAPRRTARHFVT